MKNTIALVLVIVLLWTALTAGIVRADDSESQSGGSIETLKSTNLPILSDGNGYTMPLDGEWIILDQNMKTGDFFSGGPWFWNSPSLSVNFTITDLYVVSDQFEIYDHDVLVTTTPSLSDWNVLGCADPHASPPWTDDPDAALVSGNFSCAVITFLPGEHSITIRDIHIPPDGSVTKPFEDGTVAFKAEQVDNIKIPMEIIIDIKLGSETNPINLSSKGVIPVAILGSATFDVTKVDVSSLEFGPDKAKPIHYLNNSNLDMKHLNDVNKDGFVDLISHYATDETGIPATATTVTLFGNLDGTPFYGIDRVHIVKPKE